MKRLNSIGSNKSIVERSPKPNSKARNAKSNKRDSRKLNIFAVNTLKLETTLRGGKSVRANRLRGKTHLRPNRSRPLIKERRSIANWWQQAVAIRA